MKLNRLLPFLFIGLIVFLFIFLYKINSQLQQSQKSLLESKALVSRISPIIKMLFVGEAVYPIGFKSLTLYNYSSYSSETDPSKILSSFDLEIDANNAESLLKFYQMLPIDARYIVVNSSGSEQIPDRVISNGIFQYYVSEEVKQPDLLMLISSELERRAESHNKNVPYNLPTKYRGWITFKFDTSGLQNVRMPNLKVDEFPFPSYFSILGYTTQNLGFVKMTVNNKKTYENNRFGYSISYPKTWVDKIEADNGDGKTIYFDSQNNEISVYATLNPSNFSIQDDPAKKDIFMLADGKQATSLYLTDSGKVKFFVYLTAPSKNEGLDSQFVVYANVSEQFFKQNEKIIREIAKSLTVK